MNNQNKGDEGEIIAIQHLRSKGYEILETNWRFGKIEIDIIAEAHESIVFVEVKLRNSSFFGRPAAAVTKDKQRKIIRAANHYLIKKNELKDARFDVVSIIHNRKKTEIDHIESAFYPMI